LLLLAVAARNALFSKPFFYHRGTSSLLQKFKTRLGYLLLSESQSQAREKAQAKRKQNGH